MQGDVRRKIGVDDEANDRVGRAHDFGDGEKANPVGERVDPNEAGDVVPGGLQGVGIQFRRLIEKPAEKGGPMVALCGAPLGAGLRVLRNP